MASRSYGDFHPRLSWSRDAQQLIVCNDDGAGIHRVVAMNLRNGTRRVLADALRHDVGGVQLSADGESLYFTRGHVEIWEAPLRAHSPADADIRRLSPEGGHGYSVTGDGSAFIYYLGNRVWRRPLEGGQREPLPVRVELERPTPPPVLLRRIRVLDLATGRVHPEMSLYIERGRIRWAGPERGRQLAPETVTLDAGGRFAIPGLFDMHVHTPCRSVCLAYGVTSVRHVGGSLGWLNVLADRAEITADPLPRSFHSGGPLHSVKSDWGLPLANEADARRGVRPWKELGAQFIKIHPPYTWTLHRAVADEARRQELPVVGHAMGLEEATKSVTQGFTTLEHHVRFYDDVHRLMAAAGTRLDPTLGAGGANRWLLRREPDRLGGEKLRAFLSEGWVRERVNGGGILRRLSGNRFRGRLMDRFASIKRGHELGVTLLGGTDAPTQANFEGVSLHWELEHFVEAGLAPLEVLRIATQHAAEAVGAEDDLGTLEAGKLADIVVLDANPLDDIRNTQTIWRVIKGGWVFDPEELRPPAMSNGN